METANFQPKISVSVIMTSEITYLILAKIQHGAFLVNPRLCGDIDAEETFPA